MNHQYHLASPPQQQRAVYPHEQQQPGQIMYTMPPGRALANSPNVYAVAPSMRPSSTMVDENGEQVHFYAAMSARPSFAPSYTSARPSFAPHQDLAGDGGYIVESGQRVGNSPYYQSTHAPMMTAQEANSFELPAPVPPAPHLWSAVVPHPQQQQQQQQFRRQLAEESRSVVAPSPTAPGAVSPTLQRLLHLQQAGSRRSSTSQELPSVEKALADAEAFFAEMEVTEQKLVDTLEAMHANAEKAAPEHIEAGGGELSGSFSCASVATSMGAAAAAEDNTGSKSVSGTGSSSSSSQDRVKQDLAFCAHMVESMESAMTSLRTLDATNRRVQQFFLVDKYHGNKQSFFQRLHRRVEASTDANASRRGSTSLSAHEAERQAREDAVCDRLLADILMQQHLVPPASDNTVQVKSEVDQVRICTPHTELRMVRIAPAHTEPSSAVAEGAEEVPLLLITVPARSVATFEASKTDEGAPAPSASSSAATDITALTTPARYTQMQLLEAISERLELMRRRVGALEQRRATELQDVEGRLRLLDAYDPSTDELHAARERIRREMGLFQGWLDHMAMLRARLLSAEQELFQSVLESREIRRQLLLVLEQRLQEDVRNEEDEEVHDTDKSEQVRFSHDGHPSVTAGDGPTGPARRSTQRPQLPRASTVFLAMLQRISDEQKSVLEQQQPQEASLSSPTEERPTVDAVQASPSTELPPADALRPTAPPPSGAASPPSDPVAVTSIVDVMAVNAEQPPQAQPHAGRRRGRDEMEANSPENDKSDSKARYSPARSSSVVSVSPVSENADDAYEDPLPFAVDNEESRDASTELNHEEYSLRSGKLLGGVAAFVKSVVKRAVTFSDDDSDDDGDDMASRPVKRHRAE